jgi:hypothetical protein
LALVSASSERSPAELAETVDLTPLVARSPEASALAGRAVRAWLAQLAEL